MSTVITTQSGTIYVLAANRVTRYSSTAVDGYDEAIAGDAIESATVPTVGEAWQFRTAAGPFVTTAVARVTVR